MMTRCVRRPLRVRQRIDVANIGIVSQRVGHVEHRSLRRCLRLRPVG
jgi:hypothetical protein